MIGCLQASWLKRHWFASRIWRAFVRASITLISFGSLSSLGLPWCTKPCIFWTCLDMLHWEWPLIFGSSIARDPCQCGLTGSCGEHVLLHPSKTPFLSSVKRSLLPEGSLTTNSKLLWTYGRENALVGDGSLFAMFMAWRGTSVSLLTQVLPQVSSSVAAE